MDDIVPPHATIELLASGFKLAEGPVWDSGGYLWFSDLVGNLIYKLTPYEWLQNGILRWMPDRVNEWLLKRRVAEFRMKSHGAGKNVSEYSSPNGLTLDKKGRLTMCEHGHRRVSRLEKNGSLILLADRYEGHRLNSPNDLVYRSDGVLYFTDPPFGLPKMFDDPGKELPYSGVFCLISGQLKLIGTDLNGPNGLAFSPDEKFLYVTNSDVKRNVVMRYEANADGTLSTGVVFYNMTVSSGDEVLDGMKVDQQGNLYVTGPGGVWILSPHGKHLGMLKGPKQLTNVAWGDKDGKTLYITAHTGIYRIRLNIPGIRPGQS